MDNSLEFPSADKGKLSTSEDKEKPSEEDGIMTEKVAERQVSEEDILEFTKRTGLSVFEASAKSGSGVESSFIALTDALIDISQKNNSDGRTSASSGVGSGNSDNVYS